MTIEAQDNIPSLSLFKINKSNHQGSFINKLNCMQCENRKIFLITYQEVKYPTIKVEVDMLQERLVAKL